MPGASSLREVSISQYNPLIFIKAWVGVQACLAWWIFPCLQQAHWGRAVQESSPTVGQEGQHDGQDIY